MYFVSCVVDALNPAYSSVDGVLFSKSQDVLVQCPGARAQYTIPDSVTSIGAAAFAGCNDLTGLVIPHSVTNIGFGTFYGCRNLTSITIPDTVTSIGDAAFAGGFR